MKPEMTRTLIPLFLAATLSTAAARSKGPDLITVDESGTGAPVLFLPCLGCRADVWKPVAKRLVRRHVILVSIAGFGASAAEEPAGIAEIRESIARLIADRRWRNITLIGHSFGGNLALSIASAHPDPIARVVILDSLPFPAALLKPDLPPEAAPQIAAALGTTLSAMSGEQYREYLAQTCRMLITAKVDQQSVLASMLASDRRLIIRVQSETIATDQRPLLSRIAAPLLVLGAWRGREALGLSHESVETALKAQYRNAPRSRIAVSDTARHFLQLDDPAWVAEEVMGFLDE